MFHRERSHDNGKTWESTWTCSASRKYIDLFESAEIEMYGLDWRVGYRVKYKNSPIIYRWIDDRYGKRREI